MAARRERRRPERSHNPTESTTATKLNSCMAPPPDEVIEGSGERASLSASPSR